MMNQPLLPSLPSVERRENNAKLKIVVHECVRRCRVLDWCYQPQTGFRYHLILAADQAFDELPWPGKDKRYCRACAGLVSASVQRCPYCGLQIGRRPRTVEKTTHRIHALFHANGNGHLLRVNGFEAGSKRYSGGQLVNLFHSLCGDLRTTSTSVEDVSEKSGVRFAPLHAVAFGSTWYGKFGYEFATGCFGATEQDYHQALSRLRQAGIEAALADASVLPNACSLRRIRAEYCPNGSTLSDLFSALLSSRSSAAREAVKAQQIQCDSGATKEVSARAHGNCGDASATPSKRKSKDPLSNGLHMGGDTDPHDKLEKVTKDLIEASSSFLSEYAPASRVNRGALHLSDLPRCVEVVRDTKHFVKRFLNPDDDMVRAFPFIAHHQACALTFWARAHTRGSSRSKWLWKITVKSIWNSLTESCAFGARHGTG